MKTVSVIRAVIASTGAPPAQQATSGSPTVSLTWICLTGKDGWLHAQVGARTTAAEGRLPHAQALAGARAAGKRAWLSSQPRRSNDAAIQPPESPKTMEKKKDASANGQPKRPALYTMPSGELSGDDTMKATIGAQGIVLAIMPSTTAVVPQEQSGVATAAAVAPTTPALRWRPRKADTFFTSTNTCSSAAIRMLARRYGQLCRRERRTCLTDCSKRFSMKSIVMWSPARSKVAHTPSVSRILEVLRNSGGAAPREIGRRALPAEEWAKTSAS